MSSVFFFQSGSKSLGKEAQACVHLQNQRVGILGSQTDQGVMRESTKSIDYC